MNSSLDILKKEWVGKTLVSFGFGETNQIRGEAIGKKIVNIDFGVDEDLKGAIFLLFEDNSFPVLVFPHEVIEVTGL